MAPTVYVTRAGELPPEDALDVRFLRASADHELLAVVQSDADVLRTSLEKMSEPVNLVVVDGYAAVTSLLADQTWFREKVARIFLVGGKLAPFVPLDPRLQERSPERFSPDGDPRITEPEAFSKILNSGEAVIWLPRDVCLWRCDLMGITDGPVLISALPAFLLATLPDPLPWLRSFRTIPARVEADDSGKIGIFEPKAVSPNIYVVVGIDGAALNRRLIAALTASSEKTPARPPSA